MSQPAIRVQNLSKRYRIGAAEEAHDTLAAAAIDALKSPLANLRRLRRLTRFSANGQEPSDVIWALKDVSFEVQPGEVVGIIGRNGAGKSTLLKLLSRITHPTSGRIELNGRVSSLLEVGTGFHPELTGRENIYLNGTILGMSKAEVDQKFDKIVSFSGVEKFIDTPVKRYSSGMKVRLAFSVAAHLEPEILLVDEVLAVGDVEFQKKCLGKMENVAQSGRTVLFVSHTMAAINSLCPKTILLDAGKVVHFESTNKVVHEYLAASQSRSVRAVSQRKDRVGNGAVRFNALWIEDELGNKRETIQSGELISIRLSYEACQDFNSLQFLVAIYDQHNQRLLSFDSAISLHTITSWPKIGIVTCNVMDRFPLATGKYRINIAVYADGVLADNLGDALVFDVAAGDFFGSGKSPNLKPMFLARDEWFLDQRDESSN